MYLPLSMIAILSLAVDASAEDTSPTASTTGVFQHVTLKDGRALDGRLDADRSRITLVNPKTGKELGAIAIAPDQIVSVADVALPPSEDAAAASLTPEELAVNKSEKALLKAIAALNSARQRKVTARQAHVDWDNGPHVFHNDQAGFERSNARKQVILKEIAEASAALPAAEKDYAEACTEYAKLGGTKDHSALLKNPKTREPKPLSANDF